MTTTNSTNIVQCTLFQTISTHTPLRVVAIGGEELSDSLGRLVLRMSDCSAKSYGGSAVRTPDPNPRPLPLPHLTATQLLTAAFLRGLCSDLVVADESRQVTEVALRPDEYIEQVILIGCNDYGVSKSDKNHTEIAQIQHLNSIS